jgi:glycosyltransferase involved in cell wall biosynthesis
MKILQIGKYYHPAPGGIETFLKNLCEGLKAAGDELTVLCSAENGSTSDEWIEGVRIVRAAKMGTIFSQPLSPTLPVELMRLAKDADLVHIHSPNPLSESLALALPPRIPIVVSYHSDIVRQRLLLPFYSPILKLFLRRAKRIVVATENHIHFSPFLPNFAEKCRVIAYGLNPSDFVMTPDVEQQASRLKAQHGRYVLFVGRLVSYKGVSYLISAMKEVDAKLIIIGEGPLRAELEAQAMQMGIGEKIHFTGRVLGQKLLNAYYHGCELFVLPSISRNEAFGVAQTEAMACGKPTIATRLESGVTLVCKAGVTGNLVEPKNPEALKFAICNLLNDQELRTRMGRAALEHFNSNFSREIMINRYRALYSEIIPS